MSCFKIKWKLPSWLRLSKRPERLHRHNPPVPVRIVPNQPPPSPSAEHRKEKVDGQGKGESQGDGGPDPELIGKRLKLAAYQQREEQQRLEEEVRKEVAATPWAEPSEPMTVEVHEQVHYRQLLIGKRLKLAAWEDLNMDLPYSGLPPVPVRIVPNQPPPSPSPEHRKEKVDGQGKGESQGDGGPDPELIGKRLKLAAYQQREEQQRLEKEVRKEGEAKPWAELEDIQRAFALPLPGTPENSDEVASTDSEDVDFELDLKIDVDELLEIARARISANEGKLEVKNGIDPVNDTVSVPPPLPKKKNMHRRRFVHFEEDPDKIEMDKSNSVDSGYGMSSSGEDMELLKYSIEEQEGQPLNSQNRCFKRPKPTGISPIQSKRTKTEALTPVGDTDIRDSPTFLTFPKHPIRQTSFFLNNAHIMNALSRSSTEPDLIGDFSNPYILPLLEGPHRDRKYISPDTMAALLRHSYDEYVTCFKIVDCRYPYEFEGGHIRGALNLYTHEQIIKDLIPVKTEPPTVEPNDLTKRIIIVFHCEFSTERGPKLSQFLRNYDRNLNADSYPALHYPEIYLLHGGYKNFFAAHPDLCDPKAYRPMLDPECRDAYQHYSSKSKSWKCAVKGSAISRDDGASTSTGAIEARRIKLVF